jgi:predicted GNAT superfamily acetyltransferase
MIEIYPITTLEDMRAAEDVQRQVWQASDDELFSAHSLHALAYNGAVLLGAYDNGRLIGLAFGVLATVEGAEQAGRPAAERLKMYSVMAGVLPVYQNQGIGRRLKLAQREAALALGLDLITWTFDPLESRNGRFNIHTLGATSRTYRRHFHGDMGGINAGLPTDRLDVEWLIASEQVAARLRGDHHLLSLTSLLERGVPVINPALHADEGLPLPTAVYDLPRPDQPFCLLEITADFQAIKRADFNLAHFWRLNTRQAFETLFAAGFTLIEFVYQKGRNGRFRSFYLLERTTDHG